MTSERLGQRTDWQKHRKINWQDAINAWDAERIESGTDAEALEWLRKTDGQKRKKTDWDHRTERQHRLTNMADYNWYMLNRWRINDGQKDKVTIFLFLLTTDDASNVSVGWHTEMTPAPQHIWSIIRWQFAANECGTERTYDENGQTVTNNDPVPAGNC